MRHPFSLELAGRENTLLYIHVESEHQHDAFFTKPLDRNRFEFHQCYSPGVSFLVCFVFAILVAFDYSVVLAFFDLLVSVGLRYFLRKRRATGDFFVW